jgi:hypothetical protein
VNLAFSMSPSKCLDATRNLPSTVSWPWFLLCSVILFFWYQDCHQQLQICVLSVQPLLPEEKKIFFLVVLNYALMMTLKASTICSSLSEPIHGQQDRELDWPGRSYMSTLGLKGGWIQLQL